MRTSAKAFAPGAISSFFEIRDTIDGKPIADLERLGAIGGGFGLEKGVRTKVTVEEAEETSLEVFINSKSALEAKVTRAVCQALLLQINTTYAITVEHQIDLPIGTGFGTSAGGALTTGLALCSATGLPLTYNQIGKIAHISEIHCQTGLGTVSSLTFGGGCILVTEPGAPGTCKIDRIPMSPEYVIVAGVFEEKIHKKSVLSSPQRKAEINGYGKVALDKILAEPTLENFLDSCWSFAQKAAFTTDGIHRLVDLAMEAGAVGAAQNMIGHAVHAVVHQKNADSVAEAFKEVLPTKQVIVSRIDFQGARLVK